MTPLINRLDKLVVVVTSPDGHLEARADFDRNIEFSWMDEAAFGDYDAATLATQVSEVLRAVDIGLRSGVRRVFELEGRLEELSEEPHWDANHRRFEERLSKLMVTAKSYRAAVRLASRGSLDSYRTTVHPQAPRRLDATDFLAELDSAYRNLLMDYRHRRYVLVREHFPR